MEDSAFWQDFAVQFDGLPCDLKADWQYTIGSGEVGHWRLGGDRTQRIQFEALARRAAIRLRIRRSPDLLIAWLEAIRENGVDFDLAPFFPTEMNDDGSKGATYSIGSISRICDASANLCRMLESAALQAEFEENYRGEPPSTPALPSHPSGETVAAQINRLREECQLTVDDLAEKMSLDVRSVRRHLTGDTVPYDRHVWAYQRLFSKLLNREVVISKTP